DDTQLLDDRIGTRQVLEVVAHEHGAEVAGGQHAGEVEPGALDEPHVIRQVALDVADVARPPLAGDDRADEVTAVTGDVEHRRVRIDVPLQVPDDLAPDCVLRTDLAFVEPRVVELREEPSHSRPASTSLRIHGMTSSSISSRVVVASNPSTSRALRTSGTRIWTSCSNGGSETYRNSRSGPWTLRQIALASSSTVVDAAVERFTSSLTIRSDSIASLMPWARSPPYV